MYTNLSLTTKSQKSIKIKQFIYNIIARKNFLIARSGAAHDPCFEFEK